MRTVFSLVLLCFSLTAGAQNPPPYRQFYFNPYLFNPAFAGIEGYSELFVYHRQQWLNFSDAPSASGFNLQYAGPNRVGYGFSFYTQEVVALRNTSALLTFAYRVPFSHKHYLSFGISGGLGANNLKLDDKDYSNDPAALAAADNVFYGDGNFGVLYTLGQLRLGFALPRLFGQRYISPQSLGDVPYSQLRNQLYSAAYKFYVGSGDFTIEPYALYRMNRDLQNFWEVATIVYYNERVWIGGSYNSSQGTGFFLGFDFQEKVRLGYSYELPPPGPDFIASSSHELHLQVRLGRRKVFRWAVVPETKPEVAKTEPPRAEPFMPESRPVPSVTEGEPGKEETSASKTVEQVPVQPAVEIVEAEHEKQPKPIPVIIPAPPRQAVLAPGHYVIVGSYERQEGALQGKRHYISLGYDAFYGQSPVNRRFYVCIFSSTDPEVTHHARDYFRKQYASRNAWVLTIE